LRPSHDLSTQQCSVTGSDGSTAKVQMSLSRSGQYTMVKILDSTPPTE
jgi:hypothetical protein